MKLEIDTERETVVVRTPHGDMTLPLYSNEAFTTITNQWLRVGWNEKYVYTFTWLGRPIIQLPDDLVRMQEVIYRVRPDVIIETGVAHGGSLVFYASLCKVLGRGRVIGIDVEIRPHNRAAIESHELSSYITLVEGNSVHPSVVSHVKGLIRQAETGLVVLDSSHSKEHVAQELEAYHELVGQGSYIVATDGIMQDLADVPRGNPAWREDNPAVAAIEFAHRHPEFTLEQPPWPFNESQLDANITHWPSGWLRKR